MGVVENSEMKLLVKGIWKGLAMCDEIYKIWS
jgi:hypothetical protein